MTLRALFTLAFISTIQIISAQTPELNVDKWVIVLSKSDQSLEDTIQNLARELVKLDSAQSFRFLNALAERGKSKNDPLKAQVYRLKAVVIYTKFVYYDYYQERRNIDFERVKKQIMNLYSSALDIAYTLEDDYLIAYVSYSYGSVVDKLGEVGLSVMYTKNGIDLYEKLGYPVLPAAYQFLAELLYKVREFSECIYYAKKAVAAWQSSPNEYKPFTVSSMNTVALGYHRQKIYDSAFVFYNQALELAKQINDPVWTGIVSGNMGQVFYTLGKFDTAYALLKMDYQTSKEKGFYDNAANSLQWAARTNLALGNRSEALTQVREAVQLLKLWPDANYLRNTYYTTTQIFREMKDYDSAFYYNSLYSAINDSLEKVVATSSLAITKARLNDETSRYNIQNLNKQKRAQLLFRNIIIASIVILSVIALLIVNHQRLKEKIKTGKAEQEKLRMEQEIVSAKDQLRMFTENIVEKTNLIEKLESKIKGKDATAEQQTVISELSRQTILTEDDWLRFKSLFEKIYPGFFSKLKERASDITIAEQRMAALTRLDLTTSQMAAMLGISADSVRKNRLRLRQRLELPVEANLEETINSI